MLVAYEGKEQDWQNETTRYWFCLDGIDYGTGIVFNGGQFAIAESGGTDSVLDADGFPLTESDWLAIAVRNHCVVNEEMRNA